MVSIGLAPVTLDVGKPQNMIKHVIWDFDGTLFDTYPAIVHSFVTVLHSAFFSPDGEVHPEAELSIRTLAEINEL